MAGFRRGSRKRDASDQPASSGQPERPEVVDLREQVAIYTRRRSNGAPPQGFDSNPRVPGDLRDAARRAASDRQLDLGAGNTGSAWVMPGLNAETQSSSELSDEPSSRWLLSPRALAALSKPPEYQGADGTQLNAGNADNAVEQPEPVERHDTTKRHDPARQHDMTKQHDTTKRHDPARQHDMTKRHDTTSGQDTAAPSKRPQQHDSDRRLVVSRSHESSPNVWPADHVATERAVPQPPLDSVRLPGHRGQPAERPPSVTSGSAVVVRGAIRPVRLEARWTAVYEHMVTAGENAAERLTEAAASQRRTLGYALLLLVIAIEGFVIVRLTTSWDSDEARQATRQQNVLAPVAPVALDWLRDNTTAESVLLAPGHLQEALQLALPRSRVAAYDAASPNEVDLIVLSPDSLDEVSADLRSVVRRSPRVALLPGGVEVRSVLKRSTPKRERDVRSKAGRLLVRHTNVRLTPEAWPVLASGNVDPRLMGLLSLLSAEHAVDISSFPRVDVERIVNSPARAMTITAIDGQLVSGSKRAALDQMTHLLRSQPAPFRPDDIEVRQEQRGVILVRVLLPSPSRLVPPPPQEEATS